MKLGLRSKLLVGVFVYLGLLTLVGLTGLYAAQVSLSGMHVALEHHQRELSLLANLDSAVGRVHAAALLHVLNNALTSGPSELAAYESETAELEREIDGLLDQELDLQRTFGDEKDVARFESFRGVWNDYLLARDEQLLPLSRADRDVEALAAAQEDGPVDLAYERALGQLTTLQAAVEDESRDGLQLAEQEFATNRNLVVVALVLGGVFGIVFGLWQSSRLATAVRAVSRAARRVADGDFAQHLKLRTGDEIESLADSFNVMTANLQRMHDEQRAVERMKDEFVSMVSHELRTPLNGVIGMTDLLLCAELAPQARGYAEALQRSGEVLVAIVDDILDLSKIEAGKLDLESAPLDVRRVVAEVGEFFLDRAWAKGVELSWSIADGVAVSLRGDQIRLRQVLLNLVGNALKFTEIGGIRVSVELERSTSDSYVVRFEVADTGIGIDPLARERVFQPFSQADSSTTRKYGGTGLGLPICKRLVELMGGTIGLNSQPGHGSTFWFRLPLAEATLTPDSAATAALSAARAAAASAPRSARRLLLVEDSWMNQQVALGMLERLGYTADLVTDGPQALDAVEQAAYAAILLDCQMPEMDGYQVAEALRRREALDGRQPVPIIALTASAMSADRERCLKSGMNDHLAKPVRIAELSAMLARWAPCEVARLPREVLDPAALAEVARLQRPGRPDLVGAIVDRFQADAPGRLDALRAALARADAFAVTQYAHALKGDSRRIGGNEVGHVCAELEALAGRGELDRAAQLVDALGDALERLTAALQVTFERRSACAS
ncbi:MAG: response regulator [Chloroflexi bacterium]|nr:MAG: response regulator [Chloroflexota bacterium]